MYNQLYLSLLDASPISSQQNSMGAPGKCKAAGRLSGMFRQREGSERSWIRWHTEDLHNENPTFQFLFDTQHEKWHLSYSHFFSFIFRMPRRLPPSKALDPYLFPEKGHRHWAQWKTPWQALKSHDEIQALGLLYEAMKQSCEATG